MTNLGWPVRIVESGGIPVTEVLNGLGAPYVESDLGVAVTFTSNGAPVTGVRVGEETFNVPVPLASGALVVGPCRLAKLTAIVDATIALFDSALSATGAAVVSRIMTAGQRVDLSPPEEFVNGIYAMISGVNIATLPAGIEHITNGDFAANVDGWTAQLAGATIGWNAGKLRLTASGGGSGRATQTITGLTVGKTYRLRCRHTTVAVGSLVRITTAADGSNAGQIYASTQVNAGASADIAVSFVATATSVTVALLVITNGSADFDNVSVDDAADVATIEVLA